MKTIFNTKGKEKMEQYYIVRTNRAGVFFGKIKEQSHDMIVMTNVRKLFYWNGACAVEELAVNGVQRPSDCKFTVVIDEMTLADPIQIIPCTEKATKNLTEVPIWKY